jgi:hypothetical protein
VAGAFVVAGGQGLVVLEPVEAAFGEVAAAVGRAVDPFRDGGLDPASAEIRPDLRG